MGYIEYNCATINKDLKDLIETAVNMIEDMLNNDMDIGLTAFVINQTDKKITVSRLDTHSNRNISTGAEEIKQKAARIGATAIVIAMEDWIVLPSDQNKLEEIIKQYGSIENYPNRKRGILFSIETTGDALIAKTEIIHQNETGKKISFKHIKFEKNNTDTGFLQNLLPTKTARTLH